MQLEELNQMILTEEEKLKRIKQYDQNRKFPNKER